MKITARTYLFAALTFVLLNSGCKKPGPIELNVGDSALQLITPPSSSSAFLLSTADIDTLGYFPQIEDVATSHLLLEMAEFDAVGSHHEAILARALFLNPGARIVLPHDTLYRTFDAGTIALDLLVLRKIDRKFRNTDTGRDTTVGPQYALYSVDGIGGGGISYDPGRVYTWAGSGSGAVPRFTDTMIAPSKIEIKSPTSGNFNSVSTNLKMRWTGGGDTVRLMVRNWDGIRPGSLAFPEILIPHQTGQTTIDSDLMRLLPVSQGKFLFTLYSTSVAWVRPIGFTAPILMQVRTSHNLVVQVKP